MLEELKQGEVSVSSDEGEGEEFKRASVTYSFRKMHNMVQSNIKSQTTQLPTEEWVGDITEQELEEKLPLLNVNPALNTELKTGDYILCMGAIDKDLISNYLFLRSNKNISLSKLSQKKQPLNLNNRGCEKQWLLPLLA